MHEEGPWGWWRPQGRARRREMLVPGVSPRPEEPGPARPPHTHVVNPAQGALSLGCTPAPVLQP